MASPPATTIRLALRDWREGGRWTPGQTLKNHVLYGAACLALSVLRPFPASWLRRLGRLLGRALFVAGLSPRRIALANLARVYPELTPHEQQSLALRAYLALGECLGDAVAQLHRPDQLEPLAFEEGSRETLEHAVGQGRGVIFASAHLGPWERVAGSLVHHGFVLTTLARESYDARFAGLYEKLRTGVGVGAIYRGQLSAPVRIVRTLRRGELLGVPMDLRSRVASVRVPFLDRSAWTAVGPARIALRTRTPVVVGTAVRERETGQRLVIRVTAIDTTDLDVDAEGEVKLTGRLNDELSRRIRAFPEGWVWMHPRWSGDDGRDTLENSAPSSKETR